MIDPFGGSTVGIQFVIQRRWKKNLIPIGGLIDDRWLCRNN